MVIKKMVIGLLVVGLTVHSVSAQSFWKKVGKALEESAKTSTPSSQPTKEAAQQPAKSDAGTELKTANGLKIGTLYNKQSKPRLPVITSETKVVIVEKIPYSLDDKLEYSNGYCFVKAEKNYFFIDTVGNVIPFKYEIPFQGEYPQYHKGVCPVHTPLVTGSTTSLIDKTGKVIAHFPTIYRLTNFVDGVAAGFQRVKNGNRTTTKLVHINLKGELIFPVLSEVISSGSIKELRPLREGLAAYYHYASGKYGFRDASGRVVVSPIYTEVLDFSDGRAAVKTTEGKWGFINQTGEMVIPAIYSYSPTSFSEGYAVVKKRDGSSSCFIDKTGKIVWQNFREALPFHNGYAFLCPAYGNGEVIYAIDKNFKAVAVIERNIALYGNSHQEPRFHFDGNDILFGSSLISPLGDELFFADYLKQFKDNRAFCRYSFRDKPDEKEVVGVINRKGEFVYIFKTPEF